jgi:hypothetical protein
MKTPTHRFAVYGVSVLADIDLELPGPTNHETSLGEVVLRQSASSFRVPSASDAGAIDDWFVCELLQNGSYYLRWKDYYEFRVESSGVRIDYRPLSGADSNILRNFLFGQVLSFSLVLQGIEPLHATAVRVDDRAVAFLGDCTFGKSTLAASFLQDGYPILTDDLLLIDRRSGGSMALPGCGRIKLQPDAVHLFDASGPGTPLNPLTEKQVFSLVRDQQEVDPLPLAALFVLPTPAERSAGAVIAARPLSRGTLFHELLKNSFNADVVEAPRLARHFAFAADLAREVPGFALCYPEGLAHLPGVRRAVLAAVESTQPRPASFERATVEA